MNQWNQRECPSQERSWSLNCAALFGTRAVTVVMHAVSHAESGAGDDRDSSEQDKDTGLHGPSGDERFSSLEICIYALGKAHMRSTSTQRFSSTFPLKEFQFSTNARTWWNVVDKITVGLGMVCVSLCVKGKSSIKQKWSEMNTHKGYASELG